jgi:hypothetical protein
MPKSMPLRKKELYDGSAGGDGTYDGKKTGESSGIESGPSKPTTDSYGEPLNRKSWNGSSGRKNWK